jgi:hypothetical protein
MMVLAVLGAKWCLDGYAGTVVLLATCTATGVLVYSLMIFLFARSLAKQALDLIFLAIVPVGQRGSKE